MLETLYVMLNNYEHYSRAAPTITFPTPANNTPKSTRYFHAYWKIGVFHHIKQFGFRDSECKLNKFGSKKNRPM